MSRKLTIHSDGFGGTGTVVLDEDGKQIEGIVSLSFYVNAGEAAEATLEIRLPSLVASAEVSEVEAHCPICNAKLTHRCDSELGQLEDKEEMEFRVKYLHLDSIINNHLTGMSYPSAIEGTGGTMKVTKL